MTAARHPVADEYPPAFADYDGRVAAHEDVLEVLISQRDQVVARIRRIPETRGDYRYAPGKWSIKEVVGHLSDTERVFAYRALRIGRGDPTPLASFDDDAYALEMRAGDRTLAGLGEEWEHVRAATIALFRNLPAAAWSRRGVANDQPISVRALAYVIAGHVRHHLETLATRYQV
jgi:hypothetical protein